MAVAAVAAAAAVASATSPARFRASYAMGRVRPRRGLALVAAIVLSGCSATHKSPTLAVPRVETDRATVWAIGADSAGPVQLVAVAVTNGLTESIRVDGRQAFALTQSGERIAPLPPGEAARLAKGGDVPGSISGAGKGAVTGGVLGAMGGAISGAIQGGIGGAVGAGAAVGVALSLGTTVLFLLLTQIMKAVGSGGLVDPVAAAWLPNLVFLAAGLVLLLRTRT